MAAPWLKEQLKDKDLVEKVYYEDQKMCVVFLCGTSNQFPRRLRIYMPLFSETDEDYLINLELVTKAINLNATHIVYEPWIGGVTSAAKEYAARNNISIYDIGTFLISISKGMYP